MCVGVCVGVESQGVFPAPLGSGGAAQPARRCTHLARVAVHNRAVHRRTKLHGLVDACVEVLH